jgi:hypothetical protein
MKAKVFDSVLANLGLFARDFVSLPPIKEKRGGKSLPYSPPELVQPAGGHLHTGGACSHAGQLRRL